MLLIELKYVEGYAINMNEYTAGLWHEVEWE
jgi:hypothetical protein